MNTQNRYPIATAWLVFFFVYFLYLPQGYCNEVYIIANENIKVEALSQQEIKNIFLGKKRELGGKQIKPVLLKESESKLHPLFIKKYIQKSPLQFVNYWKNRVFTGRGRFPKTFPTEMNMIDFVSQTQGAIGYASEAPSMAKIRIIPVK